MLEMTPESRQKTANILIVDDHPIVRQGIAEMINREADLKVSTEADNAEQALQLLCVKPCPFDLVIADISLGGVSGLELIKLIRSRHDDLGVLVISMHDESLYAERALRAGARGYIMKQEATEKILMAIRQILSGDIYLSEKMRTQMLQRMVDHRPQAGAPTLAALTDRELEVMRLIGLGLGTGDIARELHRSVKTIEAHRSNAKEKLGLKTSAEFVRYAIQWVEKEA